MNSSNIVPPPAGGLPVPYKPTSEPSDSGKMLGKFKILSELGSGGFGVCYLASDPTDKMYPHVSYKMRPSTLRLLRTLS